MQKILRYLISFIGIFAIAFASGFADKFLSFVSHNSSEGKLIYSFFVVSSIFLLSFLAFNLAQKTVIPPFVLAILVGLAAHPILGPITEEREVLSFIVSACAAIILFAGGLETPFNNFKKLFGKIMSLSFIGLVVTAFLFSVILFFLNNLFQINLSIATIILLGAVLASTDPAAIIPVLKQLRFFNRKTKDIIVSESAVTDVVGTILTVAFLGFFINKIEFTSISEAYQALFTQETGLALFKEMFFGIILGLAGYGLLRFLAWLKKGQDQEFEVDAIFILFVPLMIFSVAAAFGGSGYLAAFVAGLLSSFDDKLTKSEEYFNHTIEGILKPIIFLLLGALVDPQELIKYAGIGISIAVIFMFLVRPLAVFISIGISMFFGKEKMSCRDLLFISFIRETGAIPAVLLVSVASVGIPNLEGFVAIGMWAILATLILEPPLTPFVAKCLNVATSMEGLSHFRANGIPTVVLGSRGFSFLARLPKVTEWAQKHNINKVVVLHCPENKYSSEFKEEVTAKAEAEFEKINNDLIKSGQAEVNFSIVISKGFLQDNIRSLALENTNISLIFVGRKFLDFRLDEIKKLNVPLYFLD